jgi:regulatory protein
VTDRPAEGGGQLNPVAQVAAWLSSQGRPPDLDRLRTTGLPGGGSAEADPADTAEASPAAARGDEDSDGPPADPVGVARTIVVRKLTAQARTRHELAQALARRRVPEEVSTQVLDRFESLGLVDDADYARQWVESRQRRRHLSRRHLKQELLRKGVDLDDIEGALTDVDSADELEAARALGRKKVATMSGLDAAVQYRRLTGALARRGFPSGIINAVVEELLRR